MRSPDGILVDFIERGLKSRQPANVACRCTVFTRSDMIHPQNKGETLEDTIHGLPVGNSRNHMSTIVSYRALLRLLARGGLKGEGIQGAVSDVMLTNLVTIHPEASTLEAIDRMRKHRIGRLNRCDPAAMK